MKNSFKKKVIHTDPLGAITLWEALNQCPPDMMMFNTVNFQVKTVSEWLLGQTSSNLEMKVEFESYIIKLEDYTDVLTIIDAQTGDPILYEVKQKFPILEKEYEVMVNWGNEYDIISEVSKNLNSALKEYDDCLKDKDHAGATVSLYEHKLIKRQTLSEF